MKVCADAYGRGVLGIHERDRCFSVAKLFFAYGLGNSMYFPFAVGATTILWPGPRADQRSTNHRTLPANAVLLRAEDYASCWRTRRRSGSSICQVSAPPCRRRSAAAAVVRTIRNRFGIEILDGIGSTEVLHIFISNQPGRVRPGSSGVLVPGYEARVVDEVGQSCRPASWAISSCAVIRPVPTIGTARADEGHDQRPLDSHRRQVQPG